MPVVAATMSLAKSEIEVGMDLISATILSSGALGGGPFERKERYMVDPV